MLTCLIDETALLTEDFEGKTDGGYKEFKAKEHGEKEIDSENKPPK